MTKRALRIEYRQLRQSLDSEDIAEKSLAIANRILSLPVWDKRYFHLFLSIAGQKEVDTEFVLHLLSGKDKEIIVAKSDFDTREMTHFLLTDSTRFSVNKYDIPEPVDGLEIPVDKIDLVFVPLLAFDKSGHRVGYGKGFYDKFLSKCRADVVKIGLSFFEASTAIEDVSDSDIRLDFCVTPETLYTF